MDSFRTPKHIVDFLEKLAELYINDEKNIYRNIDNFDEYYKLVSEDNNACYNVIISVPPFAGNLNIDEINVKLYNQLPTKKVNLLSIKNYLNMLDDGGYLIILVPVGFLFRNNKFDLELRKQIVEDYDLQTVIHLPAGVFKPYAGIVTSVMVIKKGIHTKNVLFFDVKADGFSLDDKRLPVSNNDLDEIIFYLKEKGNNYKCMKTVSKQSIVQNNYLLMMHDY